jgi:antitoxin ParD1/3/4
MTINLPPALDALVVKKMATGLYDDAAEVVRDALRQMEARESALGWLKEEATRGFEELDRGEYVELDREGFMNHFRARRQVA